MDSTDPANPRGFLQSIPELVSQQKYDVLGAALVQGKADVLWRTLIRLRATASEGDRPTIDQILAQRRNFATPIKSAPSLFTLNGIGARLYGSDQLNPAD